MTWLAAPVLVTAPYGAGLVFGEDPTRPLTRAEVTLTHVDGRASGSAQRALGRFDYAFDDRFVVRADFGLERSDAPGRGADSGVGDLRVQAGWRAFEDPAFAMFFAGGFVIDTADDPLGSGHDQLVLSAAGAGELPEIRSHLFETVEHFVSYDGSSDRPGIALTRIDLQFVTEWSPSIWTRAGGEFRVDWKSEHTAATLDAALGRSFGSGFSAWIEPAFGLFGEDVPGGVDTRITIGLRWLF